MNELVIKIPSRIPDNFGEPIGVIVGCILHINKANPEIIRFDFSECKFANPIVIGGIACIARAEEKKGRQIKYTFNEANENLTGYIKTIFFPESFNYKKYKLDELVSVLEPYHSKNYIPLICFPNSQSADDSNVREKVISAINSIFKNQLKLKGDVLQAIYYLVDELTQNIADHSGSENGIVFAQFYPAKNYMDVFIGDYGKGLFQSYIDSGKHNPTSDEEAVNFAIFGKSTKNLPESRGFGISTSRKMLVEGLRGKFLIYSGRAFFAQTVEQQDLIALSEDYSYKGCFVALRIPILENKQFSFYDYVE
jgi:anti-sigma regulatory factor (Ser/Thr protein kinase)